jgi:integrase
VPDQIKAHFYLALNFGLREGETLGLVVEHVKVSFLSLERQLTKLKDGVPKYAPTKNRKKRKTPYYFSSPEECYDNVLKMQIMVPRTLGKLWKDFQDHLFNKKLISKRYEFHSIRNTYITSLIILMDNKKLEISITDIQLAVGHSSRQQTEAYLRDYRDLQGSQTFVPKKVA